MGCNIRAVRRSSRAGEPVADPDGDDALKGRPEMQLSSGARLGPYVVVGRIGAGGMGEV